jgi:hypothetical protein
MRSLLAIVGCFLFLGCTSSQLGVAEAPTVCAIRAAPEEFAGREVTIRAVAITDYFEFSSLGDHRCPGTTLALAGGAAPIGEQQLLAAHCSSRIEQGDLVEFTARGTVNYAPNQVPAVTLSLHEARDIGHTSVTELTPPPHTRDPRSRAWLCGRPDEAQVKRA